METITAPCGHRHKSTIRPAGHPVGCDYKRSILNKKKTRLIVDIGMVVLLPLLMAYSLIGEQFHEIVGTIMLILFIFHLIRNRKWLAAIPKGSYNARRTFQTVLDLLLVVFMVLQPVSGILMSKHLYTFIRVPGVSSLMRQIHMALAYWGFVLMSIHAGTHLQPLFGKLWSGIVPVKAGSLVLACAVWIYGIYAFIKRGLPSYMFLKTTFAFFDFSESRGLFILDYLMIMVLFAIIGLLLLVTMGLANISRKGKRT